MVQGYSLRDLPECGQKIAQTTCRHPSVLCSCDNFDEGCIKGTMVSFLFSFHLQKSVWSWSLVTYFNILVYRLRTINFSTNDRLRIINFSTNYRLRNFIFSTNSHVPHNVNWNWPLVQYETQDQTTWTCMFSCCFISFNLDHLHIVWTSICLFKFFKWSYFEDKDLSGELFGTCCMLLEKTSIHCGLSKLLNLRTWMIIWGMNSLEHLNWDVIMWQDLVIYLSGLTDLNNW